MKADERKRFNRELLTITIPLALQNLLNALVGASDALMLGRLTQVFCDTVIAFGMLCISMARDDCLFCHVLR